MSPYTPNVNWLADSRHLAFAAGDSLLVVGLDGTTTFASTASEWGPQTFVRVEASADGRSLFAQAVSDDDRGGIYEVPLSGERPRLLVQLDDPSRQLQSSTSLHGRTLYMSLAELESDIHVMDLVTR